jgi:hypothetical protein
MFATSVTTAASFLSNLVAYVAPVRLLGVFAACTVASCYIMTVRPPARPPAPLALHRAEKRWPPRIGRRRACACTRRTVEGRAPGNRWRASHRRGEPRSKTGKGPAGAMARQVTLLPAGMILRYKWRHAVSARAFAQASTRSAHAPVRT